MCDSPIFDLQGFEAPVSLWGLVEKQVPEHEREEVKDMLGESLVEQSKELHEEVSNVCTFQTTIIMIMMMIIMITVIN